MIIYLAGNVYLKIQYTIYQYMCFIYTLKYFHCIAVKQIAQFLKMHLQPYQWVEEKEVQILTQKENLMLKLCVFVKVLC